MRQFFTMFSGQFASIIGSGITTFALGVYVYQTTGSTTDYAMILFFTYLPSVIFGPISGPLVDRINRRTMLIATDSFAALGTVLLLFLVYKGEIQIWHIYLVTTIGAAATAFQQPAYFAAISQLVPKQQLIRANGMVRTGEGFQRMLSPMIAAWMLGVIGLKGVIWVDLATFLMALITLFMVKVPNLPVNPDQARPTMLEDLKEGFAYLWQRKPLLGLLVMFFCFNFFMGILLALYTPMVLNFADVKTLGILMSLFGGSVVLGGIAVTSLGGPKRLMVGVYLPMMCCATSMILSGLSTNLYFLGFACFLFGAAMPVTMSCAQTIWMKKIPHRLQGRIYSTRLMIAMASTPLAYAICGPLVDQVFDPLMVSESGLAIWLSGIVGDEPGGGIRVLMSLMGTLNLIFLIVTTLIPWLRNLEDIIPDAT